MKEEDTFLRERKTESWGGGLAFLMLADRRGSLCVRRADEGFWDPSQRGRVWGGRKTEVSGEVGLLIGRPEGDGEGRPSFAQKAWGLGCSSTSELKGAVPRLSETIALVKKRLSEIGQKKSSLSNMSKVAGGGGGGGEAIVSAKRAH